MEGSNYAGAISVEEIGSWIGVIVERKAELCGGVGIGEILEEGILFG